MKARAPRGRPARGGTFDRDRRLDPGEPGGEPREGGREVRTMQLEICIDVDDVDRAVEFYGRGLGLQIVEHHDGWAQARLGDQIFWIMKVDAGSDGTVERKYGRHWTPVHLDFVVDDLDLAVWRALEAGGQLDGEIRRNPTRADIANLSDPSGNGVDLVQRHLRSATAAAS
jgi:predicted enzyme related to lactoylglutathione lyase